MSLFHYVLTLESVKFNSNGLLRAAHTHNPAQYSHNTVLTHCLYAHIVVGQEVIKPLMCKHMWFHYVLTLESVKFNSNGLLRAAHSHNPAQYSHNTVLTHCLYAHIVVGQEVIKPLMCKHMWFYYVLTLELNCSNGSIWMSLRIVLFCEPYV